VKVFNKDGVAIAAQWSAASSDWIEVGQVTGSRDAGMVDGVPYDHVLPVEFEQPGQGVVKLKIGYNDGENPYTTAQQFIAKYELDPGYLEQIAEYIRKNAGASAPTLGAGSSPPPAASTRAAAASSSSVANSSPPPAYIRFDKPLVVDKIHAKLVEFSESLGTNGLSDVEKLVLDNLCSTLGATSRWHASNITKQEVSLVLKLSVEWPLDKVLRHVNTILHHCHPYFSFFLCPPLPPTKQDFPCDGSASYLGASPCWCHCTEPILSILCLHSFNS
jgi:phospholipase A-2-activating protein